MKKIIVPTGYMGSGSSAITDLISEYENCYNPFKSFEYVFLHCPDGVFDLEDKLLIGNNALRSDEAIRNFESRMNKLYNKKFWWVGNYENIVGKDFKKLTDNYIDSITNYRINGYWYMHEEVNLIMFIKLCIRKIFKIISLGKYKGKSIIKYNDGMRICLPTKKEFYDKTTLYIKNVLSLNSDNKNIIFDQLLLPFNLYRIDNYFGEELKVIVVERDPRDVFILNKYIWPQKNYTVPFPTDATQFCDYYNKMRESEIPSKSSKILKVKFENLIYNYDKEIKKIENFLKFNSKNHINKFKRFNPNISIKNTQLYNDVKYKDEIQIIEKKLKKYLYNFPYELNNDVKNTIEFE